MRFFTNGLDWGVFEMVDSMRRIFDKQHTGSGVSEALFKE
jgi:hypothetical protein